MSGASAQTKNRKYLIFISNKLGGLTIEHKIQNASVTKIHNYRIETIFMKIKDRVDDFRGINAYGLPYSDERLSYST